MTVQKRNNINEEYIRPRRNPHRPQNEVRNSFFSRRQQNEIAFIVLELGDEKLKAKSRGQSRIIEG